MKKLRSAPGARRNPPEGAHWAYLAGVLRREAFIVDTSALKRLSHDVVLSERREETDWGDSLR